MAKERLVVGPVLSFRGIGSKGEWLVTALVGVPDDGVPSPTLEVEGKKCPAPAELLTHKKVKYLRYNLSCLLQAQERKVNYGLVGGPSWSFTVPGQGAAPRMAYVSCNGFSDLSGMRKLVRPANAVWEDLLANHDRSTRGTGVQLDREQLWHEKEIHNKGLQRFHLLLMGGDQIYFDSIWEDIPALRDWVSLSRKEQLDFKVSARLEQDIENYYFGLYGQRWLHPNRHPWGDGKATSRDAADAMARVPTIMMWDDHDIFDGWGSYSEPMQSTPLFQTLFKHARRAFWVFQMQHAIRDLPDLKYSSATNVSRKDPLFDPIDWAAHKKTDPLALPLLKGQPGFSSVFQVGEVAIVVGDLRTERSRTQVLGNDTWDALKKWMLGSSNKETEKAEHLSDERQHLIFMSSVPVAHPKLTLAEGLLDAFGQDHVLDSNADDLKDHWSHDDHEGERKRLLETLGQVAKSKKLRVSFVSGDVHVAALGSVYRRDISPTANWAQILQFTSSAVVHPSLMGVAERLFLFMLNNTAGKPQNIDVQHTVEMLLFPGHNKHVMPARNWLALELDPGLDVKERRLWATWRCETETGFSNHIQAVQPFQA